MWLVFAVVALRLVVALASLALVGVVVGSWLCCVGGGWCRLCRLVSCVVSVVGVLWGACGNLLHPPHTI